MSSAKNFCTKYSGSEIVFRLCNWIHAAVLDERTSLDARSSQTNMNGFRSAVKQVACPNKTILHWPYSDSVRL
jgi:hypothetical protein